MVKNFVVGIVGPTASGKSALGLDLAQKMNGEIVSVDSMQVYRGMDIGTAKATAEERALVKHHLIDIIDPSEEFNAHTYLEMAENAVASIIDANKLPIIVGGTGLYYDTLISGMQFAQHDNDPALRKELETFLTENGKEALFERMLCLDPTAGEKIHPNNTVRVIRTIELLEKTGLTLEEIAHETHLAEPKYNAVTFGLTFRDRTVLHERINTRVDMMIEEGLLDEVADFLTKHPSKTSYNAIGYKEIAQYLEGNCSLDEAVERLKAATRQYAKRQLTWFRRNPDVIWLEADILSQEERTEIVMRTIKERMSL